MKQENQKFQNVLADAKNIIESINSEYNSLKLLKTELAASIEKLSLETERNYQFFHTISDNITKIAENIKLLSDFTIRSHDTLSQKIEEFNNDIKLYNIYSEVKNSPILLEKTLEDIVQLDQIDILPIFNTSNLVLEDQILCCSRRSNLLNKMDGEYLYFNNELHDSLNIFHYLSKSFEIQSTCVLDDALLRMNCPYAVNGIEDIRLFQWRGRLFGIGAGVNAQEKMLVTQILFRIEANKIVEFIPFHSPINSHQEKNWIPLIFNDELLLIYSIYPLIIFQYSEGKLHLLKGELPKANDFAIRGGTPFVAFKDKYVSIAHLKPFRYLNKTFYRHVFVVLDYNLNINEISEPFFIQRKGTEFACGLNIIDGNLLLSYGVADRSANLSIIRKEELQRYIVF